MKNRVDALAWHVMDATADDWESIDQVTRHVERFFESQDLEQIRKTILRLCEEGLLEVMPLEGTSVDFSYTSSDRCWFAMTEKGRRLWDEDGSIYRDE